jgi:hypothetical protein
MSILVLQQAQHLFWLDAGLNLQLQGYRPLILSLQVSLHLEIGMSSVIYAGVISQRNHFTVFVILGLFGKTDFT